MDRKALIVSNPGDEGTDDYCGGVIKDVEAYTSFLRSSYGGAWEKDEIIPMDRPSAFRLQAAAAILAKLEYSLIIYCGHGFHDEIIDSTILNLSQREQFNSNILRRSSGGRTIILDCCRMTRKLTIIKTLEEVRKAAATPLDRSRCRKLYDKRIRECAGQLVVMSGCSIDEVAGDDQNLGGWYSYSLITQSKSWVNKYQISSEFNQGEACILSVVQAHKKASPFVSSRSGGKQNPDIEKSSREAPYFPFAIVA